MAVVMVCSSAAIAEYVLRGNSIYDITYVLNDGINSDENPSSYTSKDGVEFKDPTREGYIFIGWFSDPEFTEEKNSISKGTTGNITVYAKWELSLLGKLLTYDLSGTYTDSSNDTSEAITGVMTYEFLDYNRNDGYQTRTYQSFGLDIGEGNIIKSADKDTSWSAENSEGYESSRGEDATIDTISGSLLCEKWIYTKNESGSKVVQTQYVHDEIAYVVEIVEEEGTKTTTLRYDLTGIDDESKTVISKTFTWSYDNDHNDGTPMTEYSITVDISLFDFVDYRTDDIKRYQVDNKHDLEFVTTDDKYVKEIAQKILSIANADPNMNNDADRLGMLLAFTQYIQYKTDENSAGNEEYWKYPVETLMDGEGDCEDTSILFCALAKVSGYDCCMILYSGHMAAGVANNVFYGQPGYYTFSGKRYYYCETTGIDFEIGRMPSPEYAGNIHVQRHVVVP